MTISAVVCDSGRTVAVKRVWAPADFDGLDKTLLGAWEIRLLNGVGLDCTRVAFGSSGPLFATLVHRQRHSARIDAVFERHGVDGGASRPELVGEGGAAVVLQWAEVELTDGQADSVRGLIQAAVVAGALDVTTLGHPFDFAPLRAAARDDAVSESNAPRVVDGPSSRSRCSPRSYS